MVLVLEALLAVVIGAAILWLSVLPRARAKREHSWSGAPSGPAGARRR